MKINPNVLPKDAPDTAKALLEHFGYCIKDINSYDELTNEEKKIVPKIVFNYLTSNLKDPIVIHVTCPKCGKVSEILVDKTDYLDWIHNVKLIQRAFPYLTPAERETLMSEYCESCWKKLMKFDEAK